MAKIKMRKARVASEGVPEPEKVEEKVVKKAGGVRPVFAEGGPAYTGESGGTVNVTVNVRDPDPAGMSEMQSSLAAMLREMHSRPSVIEQLAASVGSGVQNRLGLGSRILRASSSPVLNSMVQGENAHRALEGLQQSADRLSDSLGMSSSTARNMLESFARMSQPSRILTADDFSQLRHAGINIDLGEPGGDRTVYTNRQGQRLAASATELAEARAAESTLVEDPRAVRLRRLMSQFDVKSREALRREGVELDGPRYGMHRMDPDMSQVRSLLESATGPDHIESITNMTYWGVGRRRTCMMECVMDTRVEHRGNPTNYAIVAFNITNPRNCGIQPFCGSQQYNETIGFFVYNAARGGSL